MITFLYGLSGAGKSTLADSMKKLAPAERTIILDGDEMRQGPNSDLGYTMEDRKENIRRICEFAKVVGPQVGNVIICAICPTEDMRKMVKELLGNRVYMIYVSTPLEECMRRDPKGLYAEKGDEMSGVGSPFEEPETYDMKIDTTNKEVFDCVEEIKQYRIEHRAYNPVFHSKKKMFHFNGDNRWIINPKYRFAYPIIAKCASTQLSLWLTEDRRFLTPEEKQLLPPPGERTLADVPEGFVKFAVYRDPIERFYSACRFPGYDANSVIVELTDYNDENGVCKDQHMRRQSDSYKIEDVDYIVKLEDLNDFLDIMFNYGTQERKKHKHPDADNVDLELTEENLAFVKEYYAKDYEILKSEKVWINPNKKTEEETK